jgi:flagella basal body P-ring formation protein FlgA
MVWLKLTQNQDSAMSIMSLFSLSNASKFITHTPFSFRKDCSRVDWLSILKTKPRGRVEVVQDENDDSNMGDDVF